MVAGRPWAAEFQRFVKWRPIRVFPGSVYSGIRLYVYRYIITAERAQRAYRGGLSALAAASLLTG
jgi:hypothetical protein